jgi:hypothetical protein
MDKSDLGTVHNFSLGLNSANNISFSIGPCTKEQMNKMNNL